MTSWWKIGAGLERGTTMVAAVLQAAGYHALAVDLGGGSYLLYTSAPAEKVAYYLGVPAAAPQEQMTMDVGGRS